MIITTLKEHFKLTDFLTKSCRLIFNVFLLSVKQTCWGKTYYKMPLSFA